MIIPKECNFIHIIGFSLLCLTLWALPIVTMAETNTDSFYGDQSLNSIVDGEKTILTLSGGVKVAMENQETVYTVPDHTQSTRLAVEADNTISEPTAYTPFGDQVSGKSESDLTFGYTGMVFESEIGTYDYHARGYDSSISRFLSVDALREVLSPYVYVSNNPINRIDPSGNFDGPFDALDLAITPRQVSKFISNTGELGITRPKSSLGLGSHNTKPPSTTGAISDHVSANSGLPSEVNKSPLDTPLARRLLSIHNDPKNKARVDAIAENLEQKMTVIPGYKKREYEYRTKRGKEKIVINEYGRIRALHDEFVNIYTPNSIEFQSMFRKTDPPYFTTDIIRDQYLKYLEDVGGVDGDIEFFKCCTIVNREMTDFLKANEKTPPLELLEGFFQVKGIGHSNKRILDEFGLRATHMDVSLTISKVDYANVTIYVKPK